MTGTMPLVSVTVCVRNGEAWVKGCMEALLEQTWRPLEIIAVDDGSTDASGAVLQAYHDPEGEIPVTVVQREPEGLSAAREAARSAARGEWIAITDIDVRPMPDWISSLMAAREELEGEDVVAVTGRTVFEEGDDLVSRLRSAEIERKYRSRPRRTSLANGPCSMFRADALHAVGGFNPTWYHAEDMEVSLALIAAGGSIVYAPDALVRHVPEEGRHRFVAKRRRDARAHVRIMRRWPRSARKGMAFDFIGTSWLVLANLPLRLATLTCVVVGLSTYLNRGWSDDIGTVPEAAFALAFGFVLITEMSMWATALGSVNRQAIASSQRTFGAGSILGPTSFRLRLLILTWSWGLWTGLVLGVWDAATGANGHRER